MHSLKVIFIAQLVLFTAAQAEVLKVDVSEQEPAVAMAGCQLGTWDTWGVIWKLDRAQAAVEGKRAGKAVGLIEELKHQFRECLDADENESDLTEM